MIGLEKKNRNKKHNKHEWHIINFKKTHFRPPT
jgi:hypothetical protein